MNLHKDYKKEFNELIKIVSNEKHIPEDAVLMDYYIVYMLEKLSNSEYKDLCVFKGGTSLSKCYPNSIERFSQDIDLTYLGMDESDNICEKRIKEIIRIMSDGFEIRKIKGEGNKRNKSRNVLLERGKKIKLEVGSTVRPEPYGKKKIKTYIQEFLEKSGNNDDVTTFELNEIEINALNIERTFIDKAMAVKRHAICGSLVEKSRHIYDVVRLYQMPEIKEFLGKKEELKRILELTKNTDSYYLEKREISVNYNPIGNYDFRSWQDKFDDNVRKEYELLHIDLLFTDEKQDFDLAIKTFMDIDKIFAEVEKEK